MDSKINHFRASHQGIMPIRVLQHNLIHEFENMNPDFLELSKRVIQNQGADPAIRYVAEEEMAKSPYVLYNKINLNEAFLSYVWCNCYSLLVLYREIVVKKSYNDYHGVSEKVIDKELATKAYELWGYAMSLIKHYSEWDKRLPNPELVDPTQNELISSVNSIYLVAMTFILAHEFAHIELSHDYPKFEYEKAADDRAIELVLQGTNEENSSTKKFGILFGLCSLLFFNASTTSANYPDMDDRIDAIMQRTAPDVQDGMWGVAILAFKLWDRLYNIGLEWKEGLASPKDLYLDIKKQVKQRSTRK